MKTYSYEDIARYAEGEMTAEEKQSFEQVLAADASLQKQLTLYNDVHNSLQQHFTKDAQQVQLENTLQQMRGEFFKKQSKVVSINRYLKYAMGVAAVFLVALFIWKPWQPLNDQYDDVSMPSVTERGSNTDSLLEKASVAFNKKDFTNAASYLEQARSQQPGDSFTEFYYGISLMKLERYMESRIVLGDIFDGESAFKYEAAFYIALSYLNEKDKSNCRDWLKKIPSDAANYGKAQELLKKL